MGELIIETRGAIAVWTIDGADRRNALRRGLLTQLAAEIASVSADSSVRAIVLTGSGDKAFCAGADLKERATMSELEVRAFLNDLKKLLVSLEESDRVFIAGLNGVALGGGTELALACDLRVAAPAAELGLTEVKLGIIPGGGGTQRLTRLVGPAVAKDLILTGRRIGAAEALSKGLVSRIAPEGRLLEVCIELGEQIAANAPLAVAAAKHAIDGGVGLELDEALALEHRFYERTLGTADRLEGLKAFAEKRPPVFQGR